MKKILFPLITVSFTIISICLLLLSYLLNRQLDLLKNENASIKLELKQLKSINTAIQSKEQQQLKKNVDEIKNKQTDEINSSKKESGLSISATEAIKSEKTPTFTFLVNGSENLPFDAMDLALSYSNISGSPTCKTGDAFPQFPLVDIKESELLITGVAGISVEKIATGVVNTRFVSCSFTKKNSAQEAKIMLDTSKTHIYSLGKSVLNLENSFKEIVW
jgi:hypothetical protein